MLSIFLKASDLEKELEKKFSQISQETPVLESLPNITAAQKAYNITKKRPQHRQFPVNIA